MNASATISLGLALLAGLACGRRDSRTEAALPPATVSLVPAGAPTGGGWVAATLQPARAATLSTRRAAQVRRVLVQEGQRVAAGTLLLALGDEELQGQLRAAETARAAAAAHHRRIQALQAQQAATPSELEQAQAQLAQAQGAVAGVEAELAYTRIRAPFAGVVQARRVGEGDFVGPGAPLLDLAGDGAQELVASLSEDEARGLKLGARVAFECDGATGEAQVAALAPGGDPATHKGTLRARVLRPLGLRAGSFARLLLPDAKAAGSLPAPLSVPRTALVLRGELTGVFVAKEGRAELRWLSVGEPQGERLPVRAGLSPGEAVIDRPGALQDGQPIQFAGGVDHGR